MNNSDDLLVDRVTEAFGSIMEGLPKETQFSHIPLIKDMIEAAAIETSKLPDNLYKKKV
jgi:hypothetical protein